MDELEAFPLPSQMLHGDGRTEPFDPDRLHHTLFAATKLRGKPDAFLSRELTDSILPFLAERTTDGTVSTTETVEVAVAVLRELGHVALGLSFQEAVLLEKNYRQTPPPILEREDAVTRAVQQRRSVSEMAWRMAKEAMAAFSLEEVYPPHVAAAHREGLLTLGQLPAVRELASAVLRWPERECLTWLQAQRTWVGEELVFDAPEREWHLLQASEAARWESLCEVALGCRLLGLRLALHLNGKEPPAWAADADPPLFPTYASIGEERQHALRMQFLDLWEQFPESVRLFWHVNETTEPLPRLVTQARTGSNLIVVVDRVTQEARLHDGLDRRRTALLHTITLHLDQLVQRQGQPLSLDAFTGKTLSLARMALGAAKARREYLRRWRLPGWPAFVLDQAHVCLCLSGWENVLAQLTDAPSPEGLQHTLEHRLSRALNREARYLNLTAVLDHP
jgi:hypothetical protein